MSGSGRPAQVSLNAGRRVAIVTASWHDDICSNLREQALAAIAEAGAVVTVDVRVAGSLELAVVALKAAQRDDVDAVVALGAVIRGGTPHFDYVCAATAQGLMDVSLTTGVPVANGVLTCDTLEQAHARDGRPGAAESKGYDAAMAAVSTAMTLRGI